MLSKDALNKFKKLFREEYLVDLSDEEALLKATELLTLYRAVFGNILINTDNKETK